MAKVSPRLCIFDGLTELDTESIEYSASAGIEGIEGKFVTFESGSPAYQVDDTFDLKDDSGTYIAEIIITKVEATRTHLDKLEVSYSFEDTLKSTLDDEINVGYFSLVGGFTTSEVLTSILSGTGYTGDTSEIIAEDGVFREFQSKGSRRSALNKFERTFGCILEVDYQTKTIYAKTARSSGVELTFFSRTEKNMSAITGVRLLGGLNQPPASTLATESFIWNLTENKWAVHVTDSGSALTGYCRAEVKHYGISTSDPSDVSNAMLGGSSITNIMSLSAFQALSAMPTEDFVVLSDDETLTVYKYINVDTSTMTNKDDSALALLAKQTAAGVFSCDITGTETYMPGYSVEVGSAPFTVFSSKDPSSEAAATRVATFILEKLSRSAEYSGAIIDQNVYHAGKSATQYLPATEVPSGNVNGVNKDFTLSHGNVRPNHVTIFADGNIITDDGTGNLSDGGSINYVAGSFSLFDAPTNSVSCQYAYQEASVTITRIDIKSHPIDITVTTQG